MGVVSSQAASSWLSLLSGKLAIRRAVMGFASEARTATVPVFVNSTWPISRLPVVKSYSERPSRASPRA